MRLGTRVVWQELVGSCQSCHWWQDVIQRIVSAMTLLLVLLAVAVATELVAGLRLVLRDRPFAPPASHPDWGTGALPSTPYALRH
jgi:hypothetical protein